MLSKIDSQASPSERTIKFKYEEKSITIDIQNLSTYDRYKGVYYYNNLPIQFKVIFENMEQFFGFLSQQNYEKMKVKDDKFCILVQIAGRTKQFQLPLQKIEPTIEEKLSVQLQNLRTQKEKYSNRQTDLKQKLRDQQIVLEQKQLVIENLHLSLKQKEEESTKLNHQIRNLQNQMEELINAKLKIPESAARDSNMSEEYTVPIKKIAHSSKNKLRTHDQLAVKVPFKIDQTAKHIDKFKINGNSIQKLEGPPYQLFHDEAFPKEGKYYFQVTIVQIKNSNFAVGIIGDNSKNDNFSCGKTNCVCYNGFEGSIWEGERQRSVKIKSKEGNKIKTVINVTEGQVEWMIVRQDSYSLIGKARIPLIMLKQPILPFVELHAEGSMIKLNP